MGSSFTRDLERIFRFVVEEDTGPVGVLLPSPGRDVHPPSGGFTESRVSYDKLGLHVLRLGTRVKNAAVRNRRTA